MFVAATTTCPHLPRAISGYESGTDASSLVPIPRRDSENTKREASSFGWAVTHTHTLAHAHPLGTFAPVPPHSILRLSVPAPAALLPVDIPAHPGFTGSSSRLASYNLRTFTSHHRLSPTRRRTATQQLNLRWCIACAFALFSVDWTRIGSGPCGEAQQARATDRPTDGASEERVSTLVLTVRASCVTFIYLIVG